MAYIARGKLMAGSKEAVKHSGLLVGIEIMSILTIK